jgi:hypothetical protein
MLAFLSVRYWTVLLREKAWVRKSYDAFFYDDRQWEGGGVFTFYQQLESPKAHN